MITTRINFHGSKVRLGPGLGFRKYQMLTLGQFAIDTIKVRVAQGIGSSDAPMKPLVERYKDRKTKYGLNPIRDLYGPGQTTYKKRVYDKDAGRVFRTMQTKGNGAQRAYRNVTASIGFRSAGGGAHMLDNFTVRYADELNVRMDITQQWARDRARANEQRDPWFSFSPNDMRAIMAFARQIFRANITDLAVRLRGQQGKQVWLDPMGLQEKLLRKVA